jgi:hypothetical protein
MAGSVVYRFGETNTIHLPLKSGTALNIGDLSYSDNTDSGTLKPASSVSWASAVATPSAPTCADSGVAIDAGELTNALTGVKISYQFPWGEGALSSAGTATPTAHAAILVSGSPLVPPTPALWTNIYVETSAGSGTYKLWGITYGAHVLVYSYGAGQTFAAGNPTAGVAVTSAALDVTQYNFAQQFMGVSAQYYDGTLLGYGIKDSNIRVDTDGFFDGACASASFNVGDYVGCAKASGNALDPQTVIAVAHSSLAVGRVAIQTTSLTTVRFRLLTKRLR